MVSHTPSLGLEGKITKIDTKVVRGFAEGIPLEICPFSHFLWWGKGQMPVNVKRGVKNG